MKTTVCEWDLNGNLKSTLPSQCSDLSWRKINSVGGYFDYYDDPYLQENVMISTTVRLKQFFIAHLNQCALRVYVNFPANGGGSYVNEYSLVVSFKIPPFSYAWAISYDQLTLTLDFQLCLASHCLTQVMVATELNYILLQMENSAFLQVNLRKKLRKMLNNFL